MPKLALVCPHCSGTDILDCDNTYSYCHGCKCTFSNKQGRQTAARLRRAGNVIDLTQPKVVIEREVTAIELSKIETHQDQLVRSKRQSASLR